MKTIEINLYSFDELSSNASRKAIDDHSAFLVSIANDDEEVNDGYDDYVIESLQVNDYLFFEDGELAPITHYVENHPKAGITEFHFHGNTVTL